MSDPACSRLVREFIRGTGDPAPAAERRAAEEAGQLELHVLRVALAVAAKDEGSLATLGAAMEAASRLVAHASAREQAHLAAARAWLARRPARAAQLYSRIAREFPRDLLALRVAQSCYYFLGDRPAMRRVIEDALPSWREEDEGYECLLAMHAFALEECGESRRAEQLGRLAASLVRPFPAAVHAVTHALYSQGRHREGLDWMRERAADWQCGGRMRRHNAWHLALLHFAVDEPGAALAIYDRELAPRAQAQAADLTDATALLWRLEQAGLAAGTRWHALARKWQAGAGEPGFWKFVDLHRAVACAVAAGRRAEAALIAPLARLSLAGGSRIQQQVMAAA